MVRELKRSPTSRMINYYFMMHANYFIDRVPSRYCLPRRLSDFEIVWLKKGVGAFWVNGHKIMLTDHCIYILSPGQLCLLAPESGTEGYIISFPLEFLCQSDRQGKFSWLLHNHSDTMVFPTATIEPEVLNELEQLATKITTVFAHSVLRGSDIMRRLLELFLLYFSGHFKPEQQEYALRRSRGLVRTFLTMVKTDFKTMKMVGEYANKLFVTPNYLNQVVKRNTGFPARHHIQQCIINQAKRQAMHSDLSMKQIAYALGFEDDAHFSKYFKNISGLNFSSYRKLDGKLP
jgi:AraC family transcriptional activator of pobA